MSNIVALKLDGRRCPHTATEAEGRGVVPLDVAFKQGLEELAAQSAFLQIELIKLQITLDCFPETPERADILHKVNVAERMIDQVRVEFVRGIARPK